MPLWLLRRLFITLSYHVMSLGHFVSPNASLSNVYLLTAPAPGALRSRWRRSFTSSLFVFDVWMSTVVPEIYHEIRKALSQRVRDD